MAGWGRRGFGGRLLGGFRGGLRRMGRWRAYRGFGVEVGTMMIQQRSMVVEIHRYSGYLGMVDVPS